MATITAELRTALLTLTDLTGGVYQGRAPHSAGFPHAVIHPDQNVVPVLRGDRGGALAHRRTVQVDVWEQGQVGSETLRDAVIQLLDGYQLENGRMRVTVDSASPLIDPDFDARKWVVYLGVTTLV